MEKSPIQALMAGIGRIHHLLLLSDIYFGITLMVSMLSIPEMAAAAFLLIQLVTASAVSGPNKREGDEAQSRR